LTLGGAILEYDVLLMNKIILTVVALVLVYGLWFLSQRAKPASS
jgi:ethanolamine transporter EutH